MSSTKRDLTTAQEMAKGHKWMTLGSKVKSREVPTVSELAVRDKLNKGPSKLILTDILMDKDTVLCTLSHVQSKIPNKSADNTYTGERTLRDEKTIPFMHMVELKGKKEK